MGIDTVRYHKLEDKANYIVEETTKRIEILNRCIRLAKEKEESIRKESKRLEKLRGELDLKEKNIKYARLRILKMLNDRKIESDLKKLISEQLKGLYE